MFNMNELISILASIFTNAYNFSGFLFASRGNTLLYEFTPFKRKNLLQDEQILLRGNNSAIFSFAALLNAGQFFSGGKLAP